MKTLNFKYLIYLFITSLVFGTSVFATMVPTAADTLSSGGVEDGNGQAFKTKLVRMGNGMLVTAYGDAPAGANEVYDLKADGIRKARDIYVRTCMPTAANAQCSNQADWSAPVNISNTAGLTSASTRWRMTTDNAGNDVPGASEAFYGDSDKPNIFNNGTFAVVSWVDKYCPGGEQRMVSYNERAGLTVPFSCTYESHINFADTNASWSTQHQLSSGIRDAKQDVNKGVAVSGVGKWVVTWQEDPHGLQIGGGDGPGDGASGANATHGTDIWYAYTEDLAGLGFDNNDTVRITNNHTQDNSSGNASPVFDVTDATTEIETLDSGNTASTRANTMVVANGSSPITIIAYEETKGTEKLDSGKLIRYHNFVFNTPDVNKPGAILSDPQENSRRVRFVTQVKTPDSGLKMGIFWRQGTFNGGGPGDIMVRLGYKDSADENSTGLRPEDMIPAVDENAADALTYADALALNNIPGYNISSNTIPWVPVGGVEAASTNTLGDTTGKNPYEDARAHRAAIRGEDFYIGYSYTKDWAVATYTDMDNYNFWMRRYDANTSTWTDAQNLSNIASAEKTHAKEPRLVGMPGDGAGCSDGTNLENCQNPAVVLIAWGVETNVYDHIGGSTEGDIFYTRTTDKGETYEDEVFVTDPDVGLDNRFESQLRSTPAGNIVYSVWNEVNNDGGIGDAYSKISVFTVDDVAPTPTPTPTPTVTPTTQPGEGDTTPPDPVEEPEEEEEVLPPVESTVDAPEDSNTTTDDEGNVKTTLTSEDGSTAEVTLNEDGTSTYTKTLPDGTVTQANVSVPGVQTVMGEDGSMTTTTPPMAHEDGSSVEAVLSISADGASTVSYRVTAPDGSVSELQVVSTNIEPGATIDVTEVDGEYVVVITTPVTQTIVI